MRSTSDAAAMSLNRWNPRSAPKAFAEAVAVSWCDVQTAFSSYWGSALGAGTWALAPQPLPPCVTVAPTMPVRMVSAMVASLLSGAVAPACLCAVDQAHAGATEARVVRRELGIIQCILNCLLSIVAGFVWRVEEEVGIPKQTIRQMPRAIYLYTCASPKPQVVVSFRSASLTLVCGV